MDIRQLRYFAAIVEARSFTRAADRLHIAQPALGAQVRKLEDELGTMLLVRHSRGVEPTEAGELLVKHAVAIIRQVERARQEVTDLSGPPRGEIALGITPTATALLATPLISACRDAYPGIALKIVEGMSEEIMQRLDENSVDIGFTYNPGAVRGVSAEPLLVEDLYLVRAPRAEDNAGPVVSLREASRERLILPEAGFGLRETVEAAARERGLSLDICLEINSVATMRELVEGGIGATILPFAAVRSLAESGRLSATRIARPRLSRTLYFARASDYLETSVSRAVRRVIDQVIADIVAGSGGRWRNP